VHAGAGNHQALVLAVVVQKGTKSLLYFFVGGASVFAAIPQRGVSIAVMVNSPPTDTVVSGIIVAVGDNFMKRLRHRNQVAICNNGRNFHNEAFVGVKIRGFQVDPYYLVGGHVQWYGGFLRKNVFILKQLNVHSCMRIETGIFVGMLVETGTLAGMQVETGTLAGMQVAIGTLAGMQVAIGILADSWYPMRSLIRQRNNCPQPDWTHTWPDTGSAACAIAGLENRKVVER